MKTNMTMEQRLEYNAKQKEKNDRQLEKEHLEEFRQRAENYTDREKKIVLKTISNKMLIAELSRRLIELTNTVNKVRQNVKIE